jgi:hypothetical protein
MVQEAGGASGPVWMGVENLSLIEVWTQTMQPIACCCTSCAVPAFLFMGPQPSYSAYFNVWWIYIFVHIHCSIVGLVLRNNLEIIPLMKKLHIK